MSLVDTELLRHVAVFEHGLVDNRSLLKCKWVELLSLRNLNWSVAKALQFLN